ncbi:uncharacterized protein NPIL_551201 [Nephila pilipes]|uniref:Uncharacterized protein n=1 Tax=Nephila pilipes TaxID=299642 RepID=A0A8X6J2M8_NEPPI|nr:uncharacterized protein NPIL_551201 [Nephila pilipes]
MSVAPSLGASDASIGRHTPSPLTIRQSRAPVESSLGRSLLWLAASFRFPDIKNLLNPLPYCTADVDDDALIPYLDDDILGINGNDLDEGDEDMLPPCDLTSYDPKMMNWRLQSNSHSHFLDYDNVSRCYSVYLS